MSDLIEKNKNAFVLLGIIVGGLFLLLMSATVTAPMPATTMMAIIVGAGLVSYYSFLISVKFYSYAIFAEDVRSTTFHPNVYVVYDEEWDMHMGVMTGGGYNSPGRVLSWPDVTRRRAIELHVTASPFMIEKVGPGQHTVIRGRKHQCTPHEARAFLSRPSVRRALGGRIDAVGSMYFYSMSTSMHPDTAPEDVPLLGDYTGLLQRWQTEIEGANIHTHERLDRMLRVLERIRRPLPQVPMAREEDKDG